MDKSICPKCGSKKVVSGVYIPIAMFSCVSCLGLLFWPLWLLLPVPVIIGIALAILKKKYCKDCHNIF